MDSIDLEMLERIEKKLKMKGKTVGLTLDQFAKKLAKIPGIKERGKKARREIAKRLRELSREKMGWSKKAQEPKGIKGRRLEVMKTGQWIWRNVRSGRFTKPPR